MSTAPSDRRYARSHEWVRDLGDGTVEIGISDHAQNSLGDLVFVEVPETGRTLAVGEACAVVESVKAASDIYSPIAGTVVAVNEQLASAPELINQQPYEAGWIFRLRPSGVAGADALMDAKAYLAVADSE